ncbi:hypothetical protein RR48_15299 [Papilio machaon]|uniref:Uncharacterized protein n=1 Tax=Papilio machaon TaxID=76193 RepID=A0A194QUF5_PAPMA|nr:hypothetical protein RR48_15299 [Papilio machaon]
MLRTVGRREIAAAHGRRATPSRERGTRVGGRLECEREGGGEGVRPRWPPHTPVPVASTGGREPALRHTDYARAVYTDFS